MHVYASVARRPDGQLGAGESKSYKADDPLSKAIVAKKGDTSPEAFKEYAKIAATMGATGACVAFSAGAASPLCGIIAGTVIGWIADKVPIAAGSDIYDVVADTWKNTTGPHLKWAQQAMLSVKAYYVMRDEAISEAMAAGATAKWAEDYLDGYGLTTEPVKGRWAPMKERYLHPLVCSAEPCTPVKSVPGVDSMLQKECAAAGMDCRTYLMLTYGPWPPVASKDESIDWGLIGWDEISFQRQMQKKYGNCNMPALGQKAIKISCPAGLPPSEWARQRLNKLVKVKAKMLFDLKDPSVSSSTPVQTAVKVGAAAGIGWLLWKYVVPLVK